MTSISAFPSNPGSLVEVLQWRAQFQPDQRAFTFLADGETAELHITYAELDHQARSIAARLQELTAQGERAVLLYPAGLDYITAFYGCLYAQTIAVPVYPPRQNRSIQRLTAILADAQPTIALTTTQILATLQRRFGDHPELQALHWEATDTLRANLASNWQPTQPTRESLAFLQYTSGSTGTPKGVMLSHGNLLHNSLLIQQACGFTSQSRGVSWLPPYHDMGLIGGIIQPVYTGFPLVFMAPVAFLQNPLRWLQAITRYHCTSTAGPNFAFELCINRVTPEQLTALDLSSLSQVLNGAEPINPETLDRFAATFAPCGLRTEALRPCYGLAEATVFVTGAPGTSAVTTQRFDVTALAQDRVLASTAEDQPGKTLVSCGPAPESQRILIVDPITFTACEPGRVGEIWIAGLSVA
ncbi:MAG: fatty acyl-AMP ligase, partial [Ktedonobacteraceae bacterium]|nr:fatty acyl-AMP ligase [Ktedonobacteraceae bacterium]